MEAISKKQELFKEMVLGILIYAVVLGFFEDYTNILTTWSYSTTFFVAIVMQVLTYLTFKLKSKVVNIFKTKEGKKYKAAMVFGVWLIMFFSKFVFLFVIESIFSNSATVSGFIGLVIVIATMTLAKISIEQVYKRLG